MLRNELPVVWIFFLLVLEGHTEFLSHSKIKSSSSTKSRKEKKKHSLPSHLPLKSVTSLLALTATVLQDLGIVLINVALICWRCRSSLACILHTAGASFLE